MKKLYTLLMAVIITASVFAQAPNKMSYQAVIRDASNILVTSSPVGMQISILQGSSSGTAAYVETQTPTTNANGLASIEIGSGTVVSGTFATIDWANGPYFIKTEADPTGGSTYTITGTSELLSVPYALHAKTAENITGARYLGEEFGGGVIYYLYIGSDGNQHGLIVNKNQSPTVLQWQASPTTTNATRSWDGAYNTTLMTNSAAANYVNGLTDGGFTDWYIPSIDELIRLYNNRGFANKKLNTISGTDLIPYGNTIYSYYSSTESNLSDVNVFFFNTGDIMYSAGKSGNFYVRAIRAF